MKFLISHIDVRWIILGLLMGLASGLTAQVDSMPAVLGDTLRVDSMGVALDSMLQDSNLQVKVDPREAIRDSLKAASDFKSSVKSKARDSTVLDVVNERLYLYGDAEVEYEDITLKADIVWIDFATQTIHAEGVPDSAGNMTGLPEFSQGQESYTAQGMSYNFKTEKGIVRGGRTSQGEGYILGDRIKKQPDGSFHIKGGRYTTCNAEDPHYYILSRRLKLIPDKQVISGPLNLVIQDFPIPIVIPFGFFPTNTKSSRRNGIVLPQYGEAKDRGFFLRNLGYYRGIGEYLDLLVEGDIYSKGGWRLGLATNYNKRYKFSGRFSFEYGVQTFGESTPEFTDPGYSKTAGWKLTWSHNQPINPTTRFSANVNFSNNRFLQQISYQPQDLFTNTLASSINFSKTFNPFSLNISANHRQEVNQGTIALTFPTLNLQMNRRQPFKYIRAGKQWDWVKQIGITYGLEATNSLPNVPDSIFVDLLRNPGGQQVIVNPEDSTDITTVDNSSYFRNGIRQKSNLSTSIKLLRWINVPFNFNYTEYWYFRTLQRVYNRTDGRTEDINVSGFATAREFNFSVGASATLYGFYGLKNAKSELTVRHQIIPSIGYNLNPDWADPRYDFYREVQVNREGDTQLYNRFDGAIYGSPRAGESQSLSFSLNNVFEMKTRTKESFLPDFEEGKEKYKITRLLDQLSLSSSYNFAADSFQLASIPISARTSLLKNRFVINGRALFDPYALGFDNSNPERPDTIGRRINVFSISQTGSLARLVSAGISLSFGFSSKNINKKERSEEFDDWEYQMIQRQIHQYVDFDVPWSVRVNYNLNYNKPDARQAQVTQTFRVTGDFSLTPKWKITYSTGYDFKRKEVSQTRFSVHRDLHCWELSFEAIPFGSQQMYSVVINVRSSTLRDLRLTKQNRWQDQAGSFF